MANEAPKRDGEGKFLKGSSGNLRGRPLGRKNQITALKQELEIAVRDHMRPKRIRNILDAMCTKAEEGHVGAAKLILDKVLSNATDTEDAREGQGTFVFQVKNLTLRHDSDGSNVIDVTPTKEVEADVDRSKGEQPAPAKPSRRRPARRKSAERTSA